MPNMIEGPWAPRYQVEEVLGTGGHGVVYRARQISLSRTVVIKTLLHRMDAETESVKRFKREAEIVMSLRHQNVIVLIWTSTAIHLSSFLSTFRVATRSHQLRFLPGTRFSSGRRSRIGRMQIEADFDDRRQNFCLLGLLASQRILAMIFIKMFFEIWAL